MDLSSCIQDDTKPPEPPPGRREVTVVFLRGRCEMRRPICATARNLDEIGRSLASCSTSSPSNRHMATRWSLVLASSIILSLAVVGEPASACPSQGKRVRNARVARNESRPPIAPKAAGAEAYNLARVNAYRAQAGLAPLALDAGLSAFARRGSEQLMQDHVPHGHFRNANVFKQGFSGGASENQGSPTGWPRAANDARVNTERQIDQILASMMSEGKGGGHFDNMMNPKAKRIGIGLVDDGTGKLYLTNDFSE